MERGCVRKVASAEHTHVHVREQEPVHKRAGVGLEGVANGGAVKMVARELVEGDDLDVWVGFLKSFLQ